MGPHPIALVSSEEEETHEECACSQSKGHGRSQGPTASQGQASGETSPAGPLVSDAELPGLRENGFLLEIHSVGAAWSVYFVMEAALTDGEGLLYFLSAPRPWPTGLLVQVQVLSVTSKTFSDLLIQVSQTAPLRITRSCCPFLEVLTAV